MLLIIIYLNTFIFSIHYTSLHSNNIGKTLWSESNFLYVLKETELQQFSKASCNPNLSLMLPALDWKFGLVNDFFKADADLRKANL